MGLAQFDWNLYYIYNLIKLYQHNVVLMFSKKIRNQALLFQF